ncbi:MAG: PDZ domain-containing protein [Opitutaceae bacterium]|nr:PDZ domain-containing protein [Opitutaceae bacterium]
MVDSHAPLGRTRRLAWSLALVTAVLGVCTAHAADAPPLDRVFAERVRSVVAVEYFVETEVDRHPSTVVGIVADAKGLVVLLDSAIPGWLPPAQLKDFVIYRPGTSDGTPADYLGQDHLTGWHFLHARGGLGESVVPCTAYSTAEPVIGAEIWGVGIMGKDFEFQPYLLTGHVALVQQLPQRIGSTVSEIASPGAPVFARDGALLGWAGASNPQERLLYLENERYTVGLQNPNGTGSFFLAGEVLPYLHRVPAAPTGQPVPWLGVIGLQPVDREVAEFLKLGKSSAVVVSDVIADGPAARAGVQKRDIIVALEGRPLPRFSPDRVVTAYLEREILLRQPGDSLALGLLRGQTRVDLTITIGRQPRSLKEADRRYFPRLGITLRESVLYDLISRRMESGDERGVVANFVKPNTPAATAGLQAGDLILAIDNEPAVDYARAVERMDAIEQDAARSEFVLLISRGAETQVIRVRLR